MVQRDKPLQAACEYYDVEQVHGITRHLLRTLAATCVEKSYNSPVSVLGETKGEIVDCLLHSPSSPPVPPSPLDRATSLLDQFVSSKKNFLSRVFSVFSNDNKLNEFEHDLQQNNRWSFGERERLAKDFLKSIDSSKRWVCESTFSSQKGLAEHKDICPLRPVTCQYTGCGHLFSAMRGAEHDAICGFKPLPCEQECGALIIRSKMDKHCGTTCPMKLVKCPFLHVGCTDILPQSMVEKHCTTSTGSHLNLVLKSMQEQETVVSSLTNRVSLVEKEARKLRQEVNESNLSSEVEKLRRELQILKKKIES